MATIMTNSRPPSGRVPAPNVPNHAHHSLMPVPSRLPFPTSPAMPDRRARLKRLNMSISTRDCASIKESGSDGGTARGDDVLQSKRPARKISNTPGYDPDRKFSYGSVSSASSVAGSGQNGGISMDNAKGAEKERVYPQENVMDYSSYDVLSVNSSLSIPAASKFRHRNIVLSRQQRPIIEDGPGGSEERLRQRRGRSRQGRGEPVRFRLPDISIRQTVSSPQPQGIFLTSLAYDESPMQTERRPSVSSRSSQGCDTNQNGARPDSASNQHPPSAANGQSQQQPQPQQPRQHEEQNQQQVPSFTSDVRESSPSTTSRDRQLPVLPTARSEGLVSSRRAVAPRSTVGLQRVYLEGVEYMRGHVTKVEEEAERICREFHKVKEETGEDYIRYLKECDDHLLQANTDLRKRNVKLEVIDSDTRLVRLLNELRAGKNAQKENVEALTTFWQELKTAVESLQALLEKFNQTVLQRLSNNYISSHNADLKVPVCQQYALDIEGFLKDLDTQLGETNLLLKSFGNGLHQHLLQRSEFSERLMVACDVKAFPILGFVFAVCQRVLGICETARQWLARDEQFMHEIDTFIRETRPVARRREQVLNNEKQKQRRVEKNVRIAQSILHSNREKLRLIETELQELEQKLGVSREDYKVRETEIHQKESMVDFLKLTLQQTKRNYSLQTKRSKLLRQVKELENYLKLMEAELELVQDKILAKSHEKILLTEKISTSEKSYGLLKSDFDSFSENLEKLEAEVSGLSGQLLQLEIVHTIKTSPEALDNLQDRPSTVKLSKSLKEKIRERKKKAAAAAKDGV